MGGARTVRRAGRCLSYGEAGTALAPSRQARASKPLARWRRSFRPERELLMRRLALFCGVLLAIACVAVIAWRTQPGDSRPAAQATGQLAAVTSITRSC